MSLINQMLKDLDARHEANARGRLHREIRALPEVKEGNGLQLAMAGLLAVVVAAAGWWAFERFLADGSVRSMTVAEPAPQVPAPAPAPTASEAAGASAAAIVPQSAAVESVAQDAVSGMKLSALLDKLPPEPEAAVRGGAGGAATTQKKQPPAVKESEKPAAVRVASSSTVGRDAAPGSVDKSPVAKTARERTEAEYRKAVALVNGARIQEATDLLLDVLHQDGGHVASRQLLARLLIEQRRHDEAVAILAEGLMAQPGQVAWAMTLARLQVDRGDLAGAAHTLQKSQSFATGNADYQGFAGHVLLRQGRHKESVEYYQSAVRIAPADGRWWLGLGLALEADHRATDAREAFLRARASGSLNADLAAVVDQKLR